MRTMVLSRSHKLRKKGKGGGERLPILGNVKVFFTDAVGMPTQGSPQKTQEVLDEDIPF
jgi:hypothetical protein